MFLRELVPLGTIEGSGDTTLLGLPDWSSMDAVSDGVADWLRPWVTPDITSLKQLKRIDVAAALFLGCLAPEARDLLDAVAPCTLTIPSGAVVNVRYELVLTGADSSSKAPSATIQPVIQVKLQEMFGSGHHPTVGGVGGGGHNSGGRSSHFHVVPVAVALLAPNGRLAAKTWNILEFWESTYPQVRAELRGRYAKHPWPEDPVNAVPTRRTKRQTEEVAGAAKAARARVRAAERGGSGGGGGGGGSGGGGGGGGGRGGKKGRKKKKGR